MESSHLSASVLPIFLSASFLLLFRPHDTVSFALATYHTGDIRVNCGSKLNSTALDGREWIKESATVAVSGQSVSSNVVSKSSLGVDPVPYLTSRISAHPFHFTFQVIPGQKFIRFHFYPSLYRGFEKSFDIFTVKAGAFVLLNQFSPSFASCRLGVKYIVKEFCLNVEEHGELRITFSPSKSWEVANAFVNGIEIISMPTGLYYTLDGHLGAPIVGQNYRFHAIDNSTALELVLRLNIGGNLVSPVEDFGMFRQWTADADYFLESGASLRTYMAPNLAYTNLPKLYQTSWKTTMERHKELYSFTWKIPVNVGFGNLVRLHFCDLDADDNPRKFSILINNQIVETHADVIEWSGGSGLPVYKDYVVMMKGGGEGSECNLFINLQSLNGLSLGLLKGLEIFRLSNTDNCLAASSSASLRRVSTSTWKLNPKQCYWKGKDCDLLSWEQRIGICIGAARGLEYLHTGNETGIIHRDVKDTNILLDENLSAKISDFGLSKLEELTESKSYISTKIKGTRGYLDPHYCTTQRLTRKSDVFSFGIVMLVVLSGRPALDTANRIEPQSILADFQECLLSGEFDGLVDPRICKNIERGSLREFVTCVESCLLQQPSDRPTMAQLVGSLLQLQEKPTVSKPVEVQPAQYVESEYTLSHEMNQGPASIVSEPVTIKTDLPREEVPNRARKLFWIWPWNTRQSRETVAEPGLKSGNKGSLGSVDGDGGLMFFPGSNLAFDLTALRGASGEKLGKGSTYKVVLGDGTVVAMKFFKYLIVGKQELELQINAVGSIRHENVMPLRACCYAKREVLLVYDYYSRRSVYDLLHGERRPSLDFKSRVQIAVGAARGIAYLHEESFVHGNIKSSNTFLNSHQYGCVSDLRLTAVMMSPRASPVPGSYTAPEVSQESDVYSFGVLLLELLTGKSPGEGEGALDLVRWVESVVLDWTDFLQESNMLSMLQIGLRCVATVSGERPKMKEVVEKLDDIGTDESPDLLGVYNRIFRE